MYVIRRDCPGGPDWLCKWDARHVAGFSQVAMRFPTEDEAKAALQRLRDAIAEYNRTGLGRKLQRGRAFGGQTFTIEECR